MTDRRAVIFDVDGVLVDSYHVHFESWRVLCAELGREMTEPQFAATFGRTTRETISELWSGDRFPSEQIAQLDARKEAIFRERIVADFPAMDGALELIEALHEAGFALAVGSSGPPENVELILDQLGCRALLGAIVTGRDVRRGKPDPQVFSIAAARLALDPGSCAVVEDAAAGVAAANAAGMTSIALVSTGHTRAELAAADHTVESLRELSPALIGQTLH